MSGDLLSKLKVRICAEHNLLFQVTFELSFIITSPQGNFRFAIMIPDSFSQSLRETLVSSLESV